MRAALSRLISAAITSPRRRDIMRRLNRRKGVAVIDYFHQVDDPCSHLLVQKLDALQARYGVQVRPWLAPAPDDAAAPERERLRTYGLRDAARVAAEYGLDFPKDAALPGKGAVAAAVARLAPALARSDFAVSAFAVGQALWAGRPIPTDLPPGGDAALAAGAGERKRLGHYLGGMIHFEGEWYWSVDRLHHLEARLDGLGLDSSPPDAPPLAPFRDLTLGSFVSSGRPVIEIWFSFRSPYSWIALPRVRRLAQHYGAELRLRYILPMVMRGLPVPREKSRYIMLDTKREADAVGLPFGKIVDPVGKGVERAIAVLHRAIELGKGEIFAERALRAIWSEGADLTGDRTLFVLADEAGLTQEHVNEALAHDEWREIAEDNRRALFEAGLWGAPTYRVNGAPALWGQDRLWALEQDVRRAMETV